MDSTPEWKVFGWALDNVVRIRNEYLNAPEMFKADPRPASCTSYRRKGLMEELQYYIKLIMPDNAVEIPIPEELRTKWDLPKTMNLGPKFNYGSDSRRIVEAIFIYHPELLPHIIDTALNNDPVLSVKYEEEKKELESLISRFKPALVIGEFLL